MAGKSTFKRKQRSPFGLVDDVLGDVGKKKDSTKKTHKDQEAKVEEATVAIETKKPEVIETPARNVVDDRDSLMRSSQLDSKIELYSKLNKLESGFTKMNNQILMAVMSKDMSRAEILTLLAIVRMTLGWQKQETYLSYGVLTDLTQIQSRSSISKAVKQLVEKGFITRKSGNVNAANKLGLTDKYYKPLLKIDEAGTQENKHTEIKNPRKELEAFDFIFDKIKAPGKKAKEVKALKELLKSYSSEDVITAYNHVFEKGTLKGEPAKLHLTYLCTSIDDILERAVHEKYKSKSSEQKAKAVEEYKEEQLEKKKEMLLKNARIQELKDKVKSSLKSHFSEKELSLNIVKRKAEFLADNPLHKSMPRPILENIVKANLALENGLITVEEKDILDS